MKITQNTDEKVCPLCGRYNHCGEKGIVNGIQRNYCWCFYEKIPQDLLNMVPEEKRGKTCICPDCLNNFKNKRR